MMDRALTFLIAAVGSLGFYVLGLPLPFLLGPMFACLIAALSGASLQGAGQFGIFMRTFLGVAVGASITPELLGRMPEIAGSLLIVPLFIATVAVIGFPFLRYVFKLDPVTAWYSAMPGGLQDMLIFGEEAGGDPRALSLIHATRIVVLVSCAPFAMQLVWNLDLNVAPGQPMTDIAPTQIALMIIAGLVGWKFFERIGLFGASILGPMILTSVLSLTGVIQTRPPAEIIQAAQFFIGIAVGVKYVRITRKEVRESVFAGLAYSVLLGTISLLFFALVAGLGLAPSLDALLAFLPGGQAEMVVIAIIAGSDLAYVVTHHVLRIVLVVMFAPVIGRVLHKT
ncbi:AbrB family transcriptional regulator [Aliiroseovarius sp. F20344]|uniref:AbrB family transcriptional regulator n=1 Tax=Aliiroseovarius sp. F20344 TaxID=2926414 RepID=UPI001FF18142|nr:AbrB family transcriptional regulator [Aliiroseovarius sp. F20344]MCK0141124.1 AbrB family transcriptional regulator [Aliiroseovarius sp. F20344]